MKKILIGAMAALTVGGAIAASAVPAFAQSHNWRDSRDSGYRGDYRGGYYHRDGSGAAFAAGLAGLAVGAAIAGNGGYYDSYYGNRYYYGGPPAYYDGPSYYSYYNRCRTEWRWDRRWRDYVRVRACY